MNYARKTVKEFMPGGRSFRLFGSGPHKKPDYDQYKHQDPNGHMDGQRRLGNAECTTSAEHWLEDKEPQI
jgi:hypothetical protein